VNSQVFAGFGTTGAELEVMVVSAGADPIVDFHLLGVGVESEPVEILQGLAQRLSGVPLEDQV